VLNKLIQSSLRPLGFRIARVKDLERPTACSPTHGLDCFFSALRALNFRPRHIIDVGANKGPWTRKSIRFFPDAFYTLVEPQDNLKIHIKDLIESGHKIQWITAGASDQSGVLPLTITSRDDSCTFVALQENGIDLPTVMVPVRTLNEIVASSSAPPPDIIKIDAEGLDLQVLDGASDLLGKTEIFFVEAAVCAVPFRNTLAKVVRRMDEAGYRVADITDLNRTPTLSALWLCEVAFVLKTSAFWQGVNSYT